MLKLNNIIHTLNLTMSDTRDHTIQSLIEQVLYSYDEPVSNSDIRTLIQTEFDIKIFENELDEAINKLIDIKSIERVSSHLKISTERKKAILALELSIKESSLNREKNLIKIIDTIDDELFIFQTCSYVL